MVERYRPASGSPDLLLNGAPVLLEGIDERQIVRQATENGAWDMLSPLKKDVLQACYGVGLEQGPAIRELSGRYNRHPAVMITIRDHALNWLIGGQKETSPVGDSIATRQGRNGEGEIDEYEYPDQSILDLYGKQINAYPLLNRSQEQFLFQQKEIDPANINALLDRTVTQDFNEGDLVKLWNVYTDCLGKTLGDALSLMNLKLVIFAAINRFRSFADKLPLPDMIQEGYFGLLKAIDGFDWQLGNRFSTYAVPCIKQEIKRAIDKQDTIIRLPAYRIEIIGWLLAAKQRLCQELGREPTDEELAWATIGRHLKRQSGHESTSEEQTEKFPEYLQLVGRLLHRQEPISLDAEVGEDPVRMRDLIPDPDSIDPAGGVDQNFLRKDIEEALSSLMGREERVIILRYGLNGDRPWTLEEVGREFGVTGERIRRIQVRALGKLRKNPGVMAILGSWR